MHLFIMPFQWVTSRGSFFRRYAVSKSYIVGHVVTAPVESIQPPAAVVIFVPGAIATCLTVEPSARVASV